MEGDPKVLLFPNFNPLELQMYTNKLPDYRHRSYGDSAQNSGFRKRSRSRSPEFREGISNNPRPQSYEHNRNDYRYGPAAQNSGRSHYGPNTGNSGQYNEPRSSTNIRANYDSRSHSDYRSNNRFVESDGCSGVNGGAEASPYVFNTSRDQSYHHPVQDSTSSRESHYGPAHNRYSSSSSSSSSSTSYRDSEPCNRLPSSTTTANVTSATPIPTTTAAPHDTSYHRGTNMNTNDLSDHRDSASSLARYGPSKGYPTESTGHKYENNHRPAHSTPHALHTNHSMRLAATKETDESKINQRLKQISYGKNTIGYDNYIAAIPRHRRKHPGVHPQTPDPYEVQSKRMFDGRISAWRRLLHRWDPPDNAPAATTTATSTATAIEPLQQNRHQSGKQHTEGTGKAIGQLVVMSRDGISEDEKKYKPPDDDVVEDYNDDNDDDVVDDDDDDDDNNDDDVGGDDDDDDDDVL